jgi:hypothetical protein
MPVPFFAGNKLEINLKPKLFLKALLLVALLSGVLLIILFAWPKDKVKEVSKELDDNIRIYSVMDRVLKATFEALRQFKTENGYLPSEDNQTVTAGLLGKNKAGKNYIPNWDTNLFDNKGRLLDITGEAVVFHFITDNEITIYSPGTKQQLDGFLDSGKVTISGPTE